MPERTANWVFLAGLTLAVFALGEVLHLPAAPLLAGIVSGSILALRQAAIQVPGLIFQFCQCILGLMISRSFTPDVLNGILDNWVMAIVIVVAVIIFGLIGGVLITVKQWLPGTTGIWGISPGGATAMIVMSGSYGGDMRLVAIMQYMRVMLVAFVAAGVARFIGAETVARAAPAFLEGLFPPVNIVNLASTFVLAGVCCWVARLTRMTAAPLLLPIIAGAPLNNMGLMTIELPGWLLALDFMVIGWSIGLRFNSEVLTYARKAMFKILGAIFFMVGSAGALAAVLVAGWDIDPMTAYLATSPGGADAVAIIAASSGGDMVFIMATQTLRLFVVILLGPYLARAAAHIVRKRVKPCD